jgi:hypothetical protein
MRIICNRRGGYRFFELALSHGENIVDDDLWAAIRPRLKPQWLLALMTPADGQPADIVILDDAGARQQTAKDKIALVEACDDLDVLAALAADETRKTVTAAIERRFTELAEAS